MPQKIYIVTDKNSNNFHFVNRKIALKYFEFCEVAYSHLAFEYGLHKKPLDFIKPTMVVCPDLERLLNDKSVEMKFLKSGLLKQGPSFMDEALNSGNGSYKP